MNARFIPMTTHPRHFTKAILKVRCPEMMLERLAGLFVIERQLFTLARAGIHKVLVTTPRPPAPLHLPPELDVYWQKAPASFSSTPSLTVSGDHLFRIAEIHRAIAGGFSLAEPSDCPGCAALRSPRDKRKALAWLLAGARKDSDGFMARFFDRHISLFITRILLDTPVRPNHMTLLSTLIGLAGAGQFFYAQRGHELLGTLLVWLHTVLDGCDGEMARLTHRESRWGTLLDFWGDNIVHLALFAGLAVDLRRSEPMAPWLGALACAGALGSVLASVWLSKRNRSMTQRAEMANPILSGVAQLRTKAFSMTRGLQRMEVLLAQRDFIYVLVLCSLFNYEECFLWAAGLGAPLYLFFMFYIYRHSIPKIDNRNPSPRAAANNLVAAEARS